MKRNLTITISVLAVMVCVVAMNVFAQSVDGLQKKQHEYELEEGGYTFSLFAKCGDFGGLRCTKLKLSVLNAQKKVVNFQKVKCKDVTFVKEYEDGSNEYAGGELRCYADITIPVPENADYTAIVENMGQDSVPYDIKVVRAKLPCKGFAGDWIYDGGNLIIFVRGNKATGKYFLAGMPATFSGNITGNVLEGIYTEPNYPKTNETRSGRLKISLNGGELKYEYWKADGTKASTIYSGRCAYDAENNPKDDRETSQNILNMMGLGMSKPTVREKATIPEKKPIVKTQTSPKTNPIPVKSDTSPKTKEDFATTMPTPKETSAELSVTNMDLVHKANNDLEKLLEVASTSNTLPEILAANEMIKNSVEQAINATTDDYLKKMVRAYHAAILDFGYLRLYHDGKINNQDLKAAKSVNEIVARYELTGLTKSKQLDKLSTRIKLFRSLIDVKLDEIEEQKDKKDQETSDTSRANTKESSRETEETRSGIKQQTQPQSTNNRQNQPPNNRQTQTSDKPVQKKESETKKKLKGILNRVIKIN